MPSYLIPNVAVGVGKVRRQVIQSLSSLSMSATASPQSEVEIANYGDVVAMEYILTQSTTGTLTGANPIDRAIASIAIKDKKGNPIMSNIRGRDLVIFDRLLNIGNNRAVPTTSGTGQTYRWFVPHNIEQKDMPARLQATIAAFSDMATSGATGGTVTLDIVAWYQDKSNVTYTQRFFRISQAIVSGSNRFGPNLPRGVVIQHILFSVGTEANITDLTLNSDGNSELSLVRPTDLTGIDAVRLTDGHVTGQFSLYNSPFVAIDRSVLDVTGAGSDTIEWYLALAD